MHVKVYACICAYVVHMYGWWIYVIIMCVYACVHVCVCAHSCVYIHAFFIFTVDKILLR